MLCLNTLAKKLGFKLTLALLGVRNRVIHAFSLSYYDGVKVVCKPGTVKTYKKFEAEIYVLTKEEGGRHTAFFSNYRPQFYMRTADVTGKVELPENVKMVMPGDNVTATFELITPVPIDAGNIF